MFLITSPSSWKPSLLRHIDREVTCRAIRPGPFHIIVAVTSSTNGVAGRVLHIDVEASRNHLYAMGRVGSPYGETGRGQEWRVTGVTMAHVPSMWHEGHGCWDL